MVCYPVRCRSGPARHPGGQKLAAVRAFSVTEVFVVKLRLRERESIQEAVRRFRKLVEHSGIKKEMRRREFYEKPSDKRRRARRRAERRARMARMPLT